MSLSWTIIHFCHLCSEGEGSSVAGPCLCARVGAQPPPPTLCFMLVPHQRDFVLKRLSSIPDLVTAVPQGAFYVFPDVSAHFGKSAPDGTVIGGATDMCLYLLRCVFSLRFRPRCAAFSERLFGGGGSLASSTLCRVRSTPTHIATSTGSIRPLIHQLPLPFLSLQQC